MTSASGFFTRNGSNSPENESGSRLQNQRHEPRRVEAGRCPKLLL